MEGFYSLSVDKLCLPCMDNAECPGGSEVNVSAGYWRDKLTWEELV